MQITDFRTEIGKLSNLLSRKHSTSHTINFLSVSGFLSSTPVASTYETLELSFAAAAAGGKRNRSNSLQSIRSPWLSLTLALFTLPGHGPSGRPSHRGIVNMNNHS